MRLAYCFFSKFADILADGTFAVIGGGMSAITQESLPAITNLSLVAFVGFAAEERKKDQDIELNVIAPSGQAILERAVLTFGANPGIDEAFVNEETIHALIFHTAPLVLTEFGTYRFTLTGNDGAFADITFRVRQEKVKG